jgi:guanylate cyclase
MRGVWRQILHWLFSIGAYPEESREQAARRRIMVGIVVLATLLIVPSIVDQFGRGFDLVAWSTLTVVVLGPVAIAVLHRRPHWFTSIVHVTFAAVTIQQFYAAWLLGGLLESGLAVIFGLIVAVGALIVLGRGAAYFWFAVYVVEVAFAMAISGRVAPTYVFADPTRDAGLNMIAIGILTLGAVIYFAGQRDRFQAESDDLLHNILPDEIAARLKTERSMIADDFPQASVLFADVVGFTPMSAGMSPPQLVGLLNAVFTKFDEFVEDLGLEKIKTVGDEYMVASGVPVPRDDHAAALAELALRILDHVAANKFGGHRIQMRIGIHSGPVVAGIIGTHQFAYDLWGDTVNTASRMESEGVPGQIQITPATYALLSGNGYSFERRGEISVKGKGDMETWLLVGRA